MNPLKTSRACTVNSSVWHTEKRGLCHVIASPVTGSQFQAKAEDTYTHQLNGDGIVFSSFLGSADLPHHSHVPTLCSLPAIYRLTQLFKPHNRWMPFIVLQLVWAFVVYFFWGYPTALLFKLENIYFGERLQQCNYWHPHFIFYNYVWLLIHFPTDFWSSAQLISHLRRKFKSQSAFLSLAPWKEGLGKLPNTPLFEHRIGGREKTHCIWAHFFTKIQALRSGSFVLPFNNAIKEVCVCPRSYSWLPWCSGRLGVSNASSTSWGKDFACLCFCFLFSLWENLSTCKIAFHLSPSSALGINQVTDSHC